MSKEVVIIGYGQSTVNTYGEQIISLFSHNINIKKIYINNEEIKKGIKADLILIQSYKVFKMVRPYIQENSEIIIANRTISKAGLDKVMNIPKGTSVALLDESSEMAVQMISLLYQLGARHVELIPVYPGADENIGGKILIILGQSTYKIDGASKIINIGNSLLDMSTIIDIGAKLDLLHIIQRQNIKETYEEIVTTDFGLAYIIGQTNRFERELDILLQVLDDGIIGVNPEGKILTYNEGAEKIIGYKKDEVLSRNGSRILPEIPFNVVLNKGESLKEKLMKINGYDVVVSVDPVIHSKKLYGAVAIVKKFNDIEKKQHKLRAELIGKGHRAKYKFEDILGESKVIKKYKDIAEKMAKSDSSVLITGESGTGKELFAQAIHNSSKRKNYQFVAVNCAALPESLLESELFGYEEGAFTGARKGGKTGLFELAHKGTLFLDEIGEMPINLQMRLLRVLQEREVMRIGGDRLIKVDIRIISATNKNLKQMMNKGEFREDLYYRLSVLPLKVPPLRSRKEDILFLIEAIKNKFGSSFSLTEKAKQALNSHNWKGNVRELKNYVEYFTSLDLNEIDLEHLPFYNQEDIYDDILTKEEKDILEVFLEEVGEKLEKYLFVMGELEKGYINKSRLGRRTIYKIAKNEKIFLSEQEIRTILLDLEKFSMIKIYKGRSGSSITSYGIKVNRYLKEEN